MCEVTLMGCAHLPEGLGCFVDQWLPGRFMRDVAVMILSKYGRCPLCLR